jgi:hypothetical protein
VNHRIAHTLVGIVAAVLVVAAVLFGLVSASLTRGGARTPAVRSAIPPVVHPVNESMAGCARCHMPGHDGMPPSHSSYGVATCLTCHQTAPDGAIEHRAAASAPPAETPAPGTGQPAEARAEPSAGPVPHAVAKPYDDCVGCHAIGGGRSMPEDHAGIGREDCSGCHAVGAAKRPAGEETPSNRAE